MAIQTRVTIHNSAGKEVARICHDTDTNHWWVSHEPDRIFATIAEAWDFWRIYFDPETGNLKKQLL